MILTKVQNIKGMLVASMIFFRIFGSKFSLVISEITWLFEEHM